MDCSGVRESATQHTARFVCTTDADGNQIASFYPGAMSEDADIELAPLASGLDLVLIGASDPGAMLSHTQECKDLGIPFAADLSQQLPRLDSEGVRALVNGAAYLFCNEYEEALIERKSSWSGPEILSRVGVRVTTLGPAGARIERTGADPVLVAAVPEVRKVDPTGTGDAFRSGFLAAVGWGLPLERAAQLGCMLAVHVLETVGTQEYELKPGRAGRAAGRRVRGHRGRGDRRALQLSRPASRRACRRVHSFRNEARARPVPPHMPEGTALVRAAPSVMLPR